MLVFCVSSSQDPSNHLKWTPSEPALRGTCCISVPLWTPSGNRGGSGPVLWQGVEKHTLGLPTSDWGQGPSSTPGEPEGYLQLFWKLRFKNVALPLIITYYSFNFALSLIPRHSVILYNLLVSHFNLYSIFTPSQKTLIHLQFRIYCVEDAGFKFLP